MNITAKCRALRPVLQCGSQDFDSLLRGKCESVCTCMQLVCLLARSLACLPPFIHTDKHTWKHTSIHPSLPPSMHACVYGSCIYVLYSCFVCMSVWPACCLSVCLSPCMCARMQVCMYVSIYLYPSGLLYVMSY